MSKSRFTVLLILVCLATSITFAQSYFSSDKNNNSTINLADASSSGPMSADQFNSAVSKMAQQSQQQLGQQFQTEVAKQPAPSYTPPTAVGKTPSGTAPLQTTTPATAPPLSPPEQSNTSSFSNQGGTTNTQSSTFNVPSAASPSPTPTPPPVPANPNSTDTNNSWGIKY